MSKVIKAICELFQVKQHHSSSYHANTNGTVERQNSTIAQCLTTYCGKDQSNWPSLIPFVMMAYRKSPSCNTTGYSPFYMMFGEEMRLPFDVALEPKENLGRNLKDYIEGVLANLKITHEIVKSNDAQQKEKDKERHDLKAKTPNFSVGDQVLLNVHKVPKGMSRRLHDKSEGPYRIVELGPNFTYRLKHIANNTITKSLINATNLKLYLDPKIHRQTFDVPPLQNQNEAPQQNVDVEQQSQVQLPDENENTSGENNPPEDIADQPNNTVNQNTQPIIEKETFNFKEIKRGKFRNGQRLLQVEWLDGTRTWEPDASFNPDMLEEINLKYTKKGKRCKTLFRKKKQ